jgi:hypothetical protein
MVLTSAQQKRKAAGDPIYHNSPALRPRRGWKCTNIEDLPDELLIEIIDMADNFDACSALCLVNRRFNCLTIPDM